MARPIDVGDVDLMPRPAGRAHSGRPRSRSHVTVADDLIEATASCLRERSHLDLSLRDIADRAGTSHTMIRYYFNSKEGLLLALLESVTGQLETDLKRLQADILTLPGSPTRHLVSCLVKGMFAKPEVMRVAVTEISRSGSAMGDLYLNRAVKRIFCVFRSIVRGLIKSGTYRASLDERIVTYVATGIITLGLTRLPHLPLLGLDAADIESEDWIDFVTAMLDSQFLAG